MMSSHELSSANALARLWLDCDMVCDDNYNGALVLGKGSAKMGTCVVAYGEMAVSTVALHNVIDDGC